MKINWLVRVKNKAFWVALIPAVLLLVQAVAALIGVSIDLGEIGDKRFRWSTPFSRCWRFWASSPTRRPPAPATASGH